MTSNLFEGGADRSPIGESVAFRFVDMVWLSWVGVRQIPEDKLKVVDLIV